MERSNISRDIGHGFLAEAGLMFAANNGRDDVVQLLVAKYGADVNYVKGAAISVLSSAIPCHHLSPVKLLVEWGQGRRK